MTDRVHYVSFLKENRTKDQAKTIYDQRIQDSREVFERFCADFYGRNCPVCGSDDCEDMQSFDGRYGVVRCSDCASLYVNPVPTYEALDYYYNQCECNKQFASLLRSRVGKRSVILSERAGFVISLIEEVIKNKQRVRVLEVGCNSGAFLHELNDALAEKGIVKNVELVGVDIDKDAIENSVSENLNLYCSSVENFTASNKDNFDLILHFELIEHLHDPFNFMVNVRNMLAEDGYTYFHTPNALGLDNQALTYNDFRPLAHSIFPPMHLQAFTTQNVAHFLLRAGLKVKDISTPGNFDVDIVKNFLGNKSEYCVINSIESKGDLAVVQWLIRNLCASSLMAVLARK